jgi:aminopeptidase
MFSLKRFFSKENRKVKKKYLESIEKIEKIFSETKNYKNGGRKAEFYQFFHSVSSFILKCAEREKRLNRRFFSQNSFDTLYKLNNDLFTDIVPKNYKKSSFANPSYTVQIFGEKFGKLLAFYYTKLRTFIQFAHYHKIYKMYEYNKSFIKAFEHIQKGKPSYTTLKKIITEPERKISTHDIAIQIKQQFSPKFRFFVDIIEEINLKDPRYLFRYGKFISQHEIRTTRFLLKYPLRKIKKLSHQIADAYLTSLKTNKVNISKKTSVGIVYKIGQERIVRYLIKNLRKRKLKPTIMNVSPTNINKQYRYDHRFDSALYLDKKYVDHFKSQYEKAAKRCKKELSTLSGVIVLEQFGEPLFTPTMKKEYINFKDTQQELYRTFQNNIASLQEKYMPRKDFSFTVISFPSPEIGKKYEEIFEDILEVNMLDTAIYEKIQQKIIDVLDRADTIHVKGKGKNETDILVKMQKISDPRKETNFQNCGADMNIPVGEVFTTPQLKGTKGTLHLKEIFLRGLKFSNLKLTFKDGFITRYECDNFKKRKENKKYIEENLLFPHRTLPIGEFAIGTNTLAYIIAKKHNIMSILPTLIIEKMGPHFAIGDTCFSMSEDKPVFNPLDKKEITARENEKTALRKSKPKEAYTHKHIDITLPYESLKFITAIKETGEQIDIIKNERFVLKGTENLNKPFFS